MKRISFWLLCLSGLLGVTSVFSRPILEQTAAELTPVQAVAEKKDRLSDVKTIADSLFNPVLPTDQSQSNPYPTQSINEKAVNAIFGAQGLNVDNTLLRHIKNFYFYLEYLIKVELGTQIATYAQQQNIDVFTLLEEKSWTDLINNAKSKAGGWQQLLKQVQEITQPNYSLIQGTINAATWLEVIKTDFWKAIPITPDIIVNSNFWQKFLKYFITKSFEQDATLLNSIFDVEKKIFIYIPNIEVAYYNADFTHLRNSSEFFRLHLVLTDIVRDRQIQQCADWKTFINTKTKRTDLKKVYEQTEEFKKTSFYSLLNIADQKFSTFVEQAIDKNLKIPNTTYAREPMVQTEITCIAMLKNIEAQLHYLFDYQHLEKTIDVLKKTQKPEPFIIFYQAEDYLYLYDLATVLERFEQIAPEESQPGSTKIVAGGRGENKIIVQDFGSWLSDKWSDIKKESKQTWKDVKRTGKDIETGATDVWRGIRDEAKVTVKGFEALGAIVSGHPADAQKLLQDAETLQKKVAQEIKKSVKDAQTVLDDTVKVAKDATSIGADAISLYIGAVLRDQKLADDLDNAIKSGAGMVINLFAGMTAPLFALSGAVLYLTTDALAIAAQVVTNSIIEVARGHWSHLGSELLDGLENMVADVASTLWSTISFVGKYFVAELMDAVKLVGYITSMLTNIVVDVTTGFLKGFAAIFDSFGWESAEQALNQASKEVEAHRRLISATITTGLLIGAVVLTDGAALPLLAMTVGPQVFQVAGGFQQDERAKQLKIEQKEFLDHYKTFVDNNKIISKTAQETWSSELNEKFESQVINEERELGFYQNFLSNYFESTKEQMSFYLGSNLAPQLQLDPTYKIRFADIGSLYGFKTGDGVNTGVLNLNPSQGFPLYNKSRNTYSQEIAVYPALSMQLENKEYTADEVRKFWFNQKETVVLDQETNEVEIRWQAIYVLNSFHIGLYFGGESIDISQIIKTKKAPIDPGYLAKMLVYKKENKNQPISLGLYEHEGKGWVAENISGPSFNVGNWYRMKMQLNNTQLKLKVWQEGNDEPDWQTFNVAKTTQKTVGIISSGASIQYQILNPKVPIDAIPQLRQPITWSTEQERAIQARKILEQKINPIIGTFNLQATDKIQILKGQFIYTTRATNLKDDQNNSIDDYVILGTQSGSGQTLRIENQGISPRAELKTAQNVMIQNYEGTVVISLVTGDVFDRNSNKITTVTVPTALPNFLQTHGPLTNALTKKLMSLNKEYQTALLEKVHFGPINLKATSIEDIQKGQFIYQAASPESELRDIERNPIKNEQGKSVYDYFLMIDSDGLLGSVYSTAIGQIQSLITGNVYNRNGSIVESGYPVGTEALNEYASEIGKIRTELYNKINTAAQLYAKIKQKAITAAKPLKPIRSIKPDEVSQPSGAHTANQTESPPSMPIDPAQESLEQRTTEASEGQFGWGG
ncbi:MAG: hypothetical protein WDZ41_03045 [Candidatus Babeliales bacterium]